MKLLFLIISSSDLQPHYSFLKQNWQSYMNNYENIDCYFLDDNPDLNQDFLIQPNHFIVKQKETMIPGILNKTILAIRELSKLKEYNFIIRTNLSSFWNFKNLLTFLSTTFSNPFSFFFASQEYKIDSYPFPFGQGACLIFNNYTANFILQNSSQLDNTLPDDVSIGLFLYNHKINIYPLTDHSINHPKDFLSLLSYPNFKSIFHIRIKCSLDIILNRKLLNESIIYILYHCDLSNLPPPILQTINKIKNYDQFSTLELNICFRFLLEPLYHSILNNILGH